MVWHVAVLLSVQLSVVCLACCFLYVCDKCCKGFCAKSAEFGTYSPAWTVAGTAAWTVAAETAFATAAENYYMERWDLCWNFCYDC